MSGKHETCTRTIDAGQSAFGSQGPDQMSELIWKVGPPLPELLCLFIALG